MTDMDWQKFVKLDERHPRPTEVHAGEFGTPQVQALVNRGERQRKSAQVGLFEDEAACYAHPLHFEFAE